MSWCNFTSGSFLSPNLQRLSPGGDYVKTFTPCNDGGGISEGGALAIGIIIIIVICAAAGLILAVVVVCIMRRRRAKRLKLAATGRLHDPDLGDGNTAPKPPVLGKVVSPAYRKVKDRASGRMCSRQ